MSNSEENEVSQKKIVLEELRPGLDSFKGTNSDINSKTQYF